jgi:DNA mismatch repair protein MutS
MSKITPLRQQYLEIKRQYPNAIVFFRLGDFYETFDEDAENTSKALDIVLTSRPVAKGVRVPMAGIPYHAAENYLGRLIDHGYHVAICEQTGTQAGPDGLFPRQVVRVVTPGTINEPNLLSSGRNNYLASLSFSEERAGLSFVDITTGEFSGTELEGPNLADTVRAELTRIGAAEVLISEDLEWDPEGLPALTRVPDWTFEPGRAAALIKDQFGLASLEGLGMNDKPLLTRSTGALIKYLRDTHQEALASLKSFSVYSLSEFMQLDASTRRNLELTETIREGKIEGSLLGILDHTVTPMGKRTLRAWVNKPLLNLEAINTRLDAVGFFFKDGVLRQELEQKLSKLHDIERLVNRAATGSIRPTELVALREDLALLPQILALLPSQAAELQTIMNDLHSHEDLLDLLTRSIADEPPATTANTGIIRSGYSKELDDIVNASQHAREWISGLEAREKQRTGIKTLKVGYNKVFGYYIEISRGMAEQAPEDYIRKQTLVNAERFVTPELKEYEALVLNAEAQIHEVELKVYRAVCNQVNAHAAPLLTSARALGRLDALLSLAQVAALHNYTRPVLHAGKGLKIHAGRHPVVERISKLSSFIANDAVFEDGEIVRLITGPNMSGKSTFLRQVVLIVLMAQIGSFVPADSAEIGLVDRVFTRIGAQDAIHAGQSTFMVEMIETANILNNATSRSLLILDEIGRGTSTYDGLSIAWAIIEYIHNHPRLKCHTLFATHYHELTELAEFLPGVRNYNVAVSETGGEVVFLHKIVPGGADRSYGIHVGQLAGLPSAVTQRAQEILRQLEASSGKTRPELKINDEQLRLFPENNPLMEAFKKIDLESLSPIQALNLLYQWKSEFFKDQT